MALTRHDRALTTFATLAVTAFGCLPDDARPEPGSLRLLLENLDSFERTTRTSSDGWAVHLERLIVSLGHAKLVGDYCAPYDDADYGRIFDGLRAGPQPISLHYGLGTCALSFRVASPSYDAVLSPGLTNYDKETMRIAGSDALMGDDGVSVFLSGEALKGGSSKRFAWNFRPYIQYEQCVVETASGTTGRELTLEARGESVLTIGMSPWQLFRCPNDTSLCFRAISTADDRGNQDGEVTFDELTSVTPADDRATTLESSLLHEMYIGRVSEMLMAGTVQDCRVSVGSRADVDD